MTRIDMVMYYNRHIANNSEVNVRSNDLLMTKPGCCMILINLNS